MFDNAKQLQPIPSERTSTEIESCMNRVNDAVERVRIRIESLEDRLRPVLRGGSGTTGVQSAPKEVLSPLGDALRDLEGRMDGASERLEALLSGLAL